MKYFLVNNFCLCIIYTFRFSITLFLPLRFCFYPDIYYHFHFNILFFLHHWSIHLYVVVHSVFLNYCNYAMVLIDDYYLRLISFFGFVIIFLIICVKIHSSSVCVPVWIRRFSSFFNASRNNALIRIFRTCNELSIVDVFHCDDIKFELMKYFLMKLNFNLIFSPFLVWFDVKILTDFFLNVFCEYHLWVSDLFVFRI